jgi:hypothetical protein
MLVKLLIALLLMAACVVVHAIGMVASLRWLNTRVARGGSRFWSTAWILIGTASWFIVLHLVEIAFWAFLYWLKAGMDDLQSALYFSAVTYTTTGYGDLLLPSEWRLVGAVEALTGILMCGWSAAFFFAIVSRIHQTRA